MIEKHGVLYFSAIKACRQHEPWAIIMSGCLRKAPLAVLIDTRLLPLIISTETQLRGVG